jgi:RNA-directed DNA polymerase
MKCLRQRVKDASLLRLIERFLKAGIMEEGKFIQTDRGTPQGGVLSPILANIYLHYILDLWLEKVVRKSLRGFANLIRYADDFIACFQSPTEAKVFGDKLKQRLGRFGLRIAENKSRIIDFGRYVWQSSQKESKWINRRSQKKSYTCKQYCDFKKFNPLPQAKIYRLTYALLSY